MLNGLGDAIAVMVVFAAIGAVVAAAAIGFLGYHLVIALFQYLT